MKKNLALYFIISWIETASHKLSRWKSKGCSVCWLKFSLHALQTTNLTVLVLYLWLAISRSGSKCEMALSEVKAWSTHWLSKLLFSLLSAFFSLMRWLSDATLIQWHWWPAIRRHWADSWPTGSPPLSRRALLIYSNCLSAAASSSASSKL